MRLIVFIFLGSLLGCNTTSNPACTWNTYECLARVEAIKPLNSQSDSLYSVELKFNNSSLQNQPQYLEELQKVKITARFLKENRIKLGNKYKFSVSEKIEGNCPSPVVTFHHHLK